MSTAEVTRLSKDGKVKGRAADGTPIELKFGEKSLAAKLAEQQERGRRRHRRR